MGIFQTLIIGTLIIVLVALFSPGIYHQGKNKIIYMIKSSVVEDEQDYTFNYTLINSTADYGKIFNVFNCVSDEQCYSFFMVQGIKCNSKTCYIDGVNNNG